jgi:calmodulin
MFMLATSATFGVYFIFYLIDHHGPVTMAIALLVKQIVSVYMSAALYNHTVTAAASAFAFLTFTAVVAKPLLKHYLEEADVPLKTGTLRKGLNITAQLRAQLGHEVQASATLLLAAARLKAVLMKKDPRLTKEDSFTLAIKAVFDKFDPDGTGRIDKEHLGNVLSSLGHSHSREELEAMIGEFTPVGDGTIHFADFSSMMQKLAITRNVEELREAFQVFDEDKRGTISAANLRHVMANIGEKLSDEDVAKILEQVDTDKVGEITFSEFVKLMEG